MTRIFTDGAEMGDNLFWDVPSTVANVTTAPRSGARHYSLGNSITAQKNIPAQAEFYFRCPVYFLNNNVGAFLLWRAGGTTLGSIRRNISTQKLEIYTSTGTLLVTGTIALLINTWYLVEVHVKIDNSAGVIEVRLDGSSEVVFSGDTQPGADATVDNLQVSGQSGSGTYCDDLALNDTAGSADNAWCGDGKIVMFSPTAAGDVTQLTPSAGANYTDVDDIPPNTSDYVSSATAGQYDLYNCGTLALAAGEIVRRVQVEARAREESATGDRINLGVKTEAVEYFGSGQVVGASYARYVGNDLRLNPNTGLAWTQGELDALQIGVLVV